MPPRVIHHHDTLAPHKNQLRAAARAPIQMSCTGSSRHESVLTFSGKSYPDRRMTSMRSFSGPGMVSKTLAVQMNRHCSIAPKNFPCLRVRSGMFGRLTSAIEGRRVGGWRGLRVAQKTVSVPLCSCSRHGSRASFVRRRIGVRRQAASKKRVTDPCPAVVRLAAAVGSTVRHGTRRLLHVCLEAQLVHRSYK